MDFCELICILSMVIKVPPSNENLACSYCTSIDALSNECMKDPISCWHLKTKELLYCLTTIEYRKTVALKTRRCVDHSLFPIDIQILKQLSQPNECTLKSSTACNCTTCTLKPTPMIEIHNLQQDPDYYEQIGNKSNSIIRNTKNRPKKLSFEQAQSVASKTISNFTFFTIVCLIYLF